jgi:hypothetical protein
MACVLGARSRGAHLAAALAAASLWVVGSPAHAAPTWVHNMFATHLVGRPKAPPVARYQIESGGEFILDRTAGRPLLKFEDNPEVFALTASRGPGGAIIYWSDTRQPMLRMTKVGGTTVFTPKRPEGSAAAMAGSAPPIRLTSLGWIAFTQRLGVAALRARQVTQRPLVFEAPNADAVSDALIADAAVVATEAFAGLATRSGGHAMFARLARVDFITGAEPSAAVRDGVLLITVTPALGLSGRPSSLRIQQALGSRPATTWAGLSP